MMIVGSHESHSIAPPDQDSSKNIDASQRRHLSATGEEAEKVRAEPGGGCRILGGSRNPGHRLGRRRPALLLRSRSLAKRTISRSTCRFSLRSNSGPKY